MATADSGWRLTLTPTLTLTLTLTLTPSPTPTLPLTLPLPLTSNQGPVSSTPNTKSLQPVLGAEDGVYKLARLGYYKYRAANLMFGFNTHVTSRLAPTPNPNPNPNPNP